MPPSSTDPYKSRLLNYLNSQRVRLKDRLEKGLRQLKNVATLGVQIVLYPLYLLVQASRITRRQFQQNAAKIPLLLNSPPPTLEAEQPILKVLGAIPPHLVISEGQANLKLQQILNPYHQNQGGGFATTVQKQELPALAPATTPLQIRGIASIISKRNLVLVSQDNLILDILAEKEQEQLEKRIYLEVANFYYQKRLQSNLKSRVLNFVPVLEPAPVQVFAPIRLAWEVMRWEQHSDIATSINLFGEATLTPVELDFPLVVTPEFFSHLAEVSLATLSHWWGKMQPVTAAEQTITIDNPEIQSRLEKLLQAALIYFYGQPLPPSPSSLTAPENPFALQVLIAAALEYFFVKKPSQAQIPAAVVKTEEDPWLIWDDLYPEAQPVSVESSFSPIYPSPELTPSAAIRKVRPSRKKPPAAVVKSEWLEDLPHEQWLDAEAQPVGYVEHPLERVLKVLDSLILWLEELVSAVYRWLLRLWQKPKRR
jgi:hypothetical protein